MSLVYKLFRIKITAEDHIDNLISQKPRYINIQFEEDRDNGYIISLKTENETRQLGLFRSLDMFGFPVLTHGDEARGLQYSSELAVRLKDRGYNPKINDVSSNEYLTERIESLEKIASLFSKIINV